MGVRCVVGVEGRGEEDGGGEKGVMEMAGGAERGEESGAHCVCFRDALTDLEFLWGLGVLRGGHFQWSSHTDDG